MRRSAATATVPSAMACRVLIVDDDNLFAGFLAVHLAEDRRFEVVGRARNGLEALELAHALHPDVVTMDVEMPELDGIAATRAILARDPDTRIVVVSSSVVAGAEDARDSGAVAYVSKSRAAQDLTDVLLAACRGAAFAEVA